MLFAVDYNNNRVHIDETHSNQEYYCPFCGAPLTTKKGDVRQHHFAHKLFSSANRHTFTGISRVIHGLKPVPQ